MSKWLKNILALVILALLVWYLAGHWQELKVLIKLNPWQLFVLHALWFLSLLTSADVVCYLLDALKIRTSFWDMVWLNNAAILLNYAPMKFGTVFRANYLKRHYGLAYARFATFFMYITFLMASTASVIALVLLAVLYGFEEYESKVLALVFVITIASSVVFFFMPLPQPKGKGRLMTAIRNFLTSRKQVSREGKAIFISSVLLTVNFLLTALRIGLIYRSMGTDIHPGGCLILGAIGFVVLFISLTPGALGIREAILGFSAVVLGIPLEVGILAAMIDRAITMSYAFFVGGCCTIWLWRKSPADFKETKTDLNQ